MRGACGRALGPAGVTRALEALGEAIVEMRQAPDARVPLEVALIRLTRPELDTDVAALVERVARLERRLAEQGAGEAAGFDAADGAGAGPCDAGGSGTGAGQRDPSGPGSGPAAEARRRMQARDDAAASTDRPVTAARAAAPPGDGTPPEQAAETHEAAPREPAEPAADRALPSTEELAVAWRDAVLEGLAPAAKARFRAGRFLGVVDGGADAAAVYGLPNAIHRDRCEERRPEVEAALARHFGRPVPLRLVVDEAAGAVPPGGAPPPLGRRATLSRPRPAGRRPRRRPGRSPCAPGRDRRRRDGDRPHHAGLSRLAGGGIGRWPRHPPTTNPASPTPSSPRSSPTTAPPRANRAEAGAFDLSSLLDSAQQLMSAQQEAAESEVVGSAGGGKVEVTVTGGGEFRRVRISPDVVDPADIPLLEDLVLAALRDAMARVNAAQAAALGGLDLGGLGGLGGLLGDR